MTKNKIESLNSIFNKFDSTYKRENYLNILRGSLRVLTFVIIIISLLSFSEAMFYFGKGIRGTMFFILLLSSLSLFYFFIIKPSLCYFGIIKKIDYDDLAKKLGERIPSIKDNLLNVLQISRTQEPRYGYSNDLVENSIKTIKSKIETVDFDIILDKEILVKPRNYALTAIISFLTLLFFFGSLFVGSSNRIIHFTQTFQPPAPFTISIMPGNIEITKGDSVKIFISVEGKKPETIFLNYKNPEQNQYETIPLKTNGSQNTFLFPSLKEDMEYYAFCGDVISEKYLIKVIDRPVIRTLRIFVSPPAYTGIESKYLDDNVGDFSAIRGSRARIELDINKDVSTAKIFFSDSQNVSMITNSKKAVVEFSVTKDRTYHIELADDKGSKNSDPIEYSMKALSDEYPSINIASPGKNSDITEDMRLSLQMKIKDDYGFSKCRIGYRIVKTKYSSPQENFTYVNVPLTSLSQKEQDVFYLWNLSALELAPDDVAGYFVEIFDNDIISGPKSSKSSEYFVRFPSLDEILKKSEEAQKRAFQEIDKAHDEAKDLKKKLDDINQDLKKSKDIDWQKQKKMEDLAKKYNELQKKVEEVSKNVEEASKSMMENKLISPETMDKYMELQKLMSEINSPEFSQALKKLQESMQSLNPEAMKQAMQNFTFNEQSFRMGLERTMSIMKRVMIEQKTDDVMKRIDKMLEQQSALNKEASKTNSNDKNKLPELSNKQNELKNELNTAQKELNDLQNRIQEFKDEMPLNQLQKISENMQNQNTDQKMQSSSQQMQQGDMKGAQNSQKQVMQDLAELQKQMQQFKKNLLEGQRQQVMNAIKKSLKELLEISKDEEGLKNQTKDYNQFSQKSRELAQKQANLQNDLMNVVNQLYSLSQKSFAVTPQIGKSIGNALAKMNQSIKSLSDRDIASAATQQTEAMSSLNQTAIQLQSAMKKMSDQGGQGGGMQSLLQQLGNMASKQQGINQGMMPFGGSGGQLTPQQQAELSRMMGEQQAVKKSLEQLKEEAERFGNQDKILGDLDKISKDMQEVIENMKSQNVNDNTIQKQERILSRLLDAQRSMRERDFEKQRKSNTGNEFTRQSPKDLDLNSLDGKNKLQKDLLKAIESGYAKDYENIIRKYFETLGKSLPKK